MARRKKHMRLPNGFGSIQYLGKGRRNPYAVYPPIKDFDEDGKAIRERALCYVETWEIGFSVLLAYKVGNYYTGYENDVKIEIRGRGIDADSIVASFNSMMRIEPEHSPTFSEVYEDFFKWKFGGKRKFAESTINVTKAAYKNCSDLHDMKWSDIKTNTMQAVLDDCVLSYASLEHIKNLLNQMYKFAISTGISERNLSKEVNIMVLDNDKHGVPFTNNDIMNLWSIHEKNQTAEMLLIMCYSGFRIKEYQIIEVNLEERYFKGGIKTRASKERIVPIHSAIYPLVKKRMKRDGGLLCVEPQSFRKSMYKLLDDLGIEKHTPHDARHLL